MKRLVKYSDKLTGVATSRYTAEANTRELCPVCDRELLTFTRKTVIEITAHWLQQWYDVIEGNMIWHTCSPRCNELFRLSPINFMKENFIEECEEPTDLV